MTPDGLLALIDQYASNSHGSEGSQLSQERALALARYNQELFGDEVEGRSSLVSSELRDTVETVVPQLMRIFLGGDVICEFDPETQEDVAGAKQESRYVNFVVTQRNAAFQVFGSWFRDALLCKNGYVKAWWESRSDVRVEPYKGLTDDGLQAIMADADVQVISQKDYPAPQTPMGSMQPMMLHDIEVRRVKKTEYARIDNVPPEEIRVHISTRGPDLRDAVYVEHRVNKTLSEIRQMGYDVPDDWAGIMTDGMLDMESQARDRFQELMASADESTDASMRRATFREVWIRVDMDNDGIAELRRICIVGNHILHDEECAFIPIACITPVIQPHRHIGYGYYDFLRDIENATTAMLRNFFDNIYLANNGRYAVDVDKVNVDDMLISRPGGIVRTRGDPAQAVFPLTHPSMSDAAARGMEYLAQWKKSATGVVMDSGAISSDVLSKAPASSIAQVVSVWQARVEGVARCFAETGIQELFRIVHAITQQNSTQAEKVQIAGQWIEVDPREWVKRTSLTVTVGLGTGSKEAKLAFLQQVAAGQQQGLQIGIAKPQNLYETAIEMMKEGGYKDGARFWTDPMKEPPPQPQKDPIVQAEEVKAQAAMQLEPMKLQAQAAIEDKKTQNNMQQAQMEANTTAELERFKIEKQAELERFKAQLAAEVELQKAQIAAGAQIRSAVKTQTGEDPNDEEVIANKQVEAQRVAQRDQSMADLAQAIAMLAHATQNPPDRAIVVKNGTKMAVSVPRQVQ
jgi:hypothetical protein